MPDVAGGTARARGIGAYIAPFPPPVRAILRKLRATVRAAAPGARETISYRIPAFALDGMLVWFAAFKGHIGFYPPVRGDVRLQQAVAPYAGPKGNLRFPYDRPVPYRLVERIVKLRVRQDRARAAGRRDPKVSAMGRGAGRG